MPFRRPITELRPDQAMSRAIRQYDVTRGWSRSRQETLAEEKESSDGSHLDGGQTNKAKEGLLSRDREMNMED